MLKSHPAVHPGSPLTRYTTGGNELNLPVFHRTIRRNTWVNTCRPLSTPSNYEPVMLVFVSLHATNFQILRHSALLNFTKGL